MQSRRIYQAKTTATAPHPEYVRSRYSKIYTHKMSSSANYTAGQLTFSVNYRFQPLSLDRKPEYGVRYYFSVKIGPRQTFLFILFEYASGVHNRVVI